MPAEIIFLCLPTPPGEDGSADLKYILQVAERPRKDLRAQPGRGVQAAVDKIHRAGGDDKRRRRAAIRKNAGPAFGFNVASANPEFLREGFAVEDFLRPERVVSGSTHERAIGALRDLYEPFLQTGSKVIRDGTKKAPR